MDLTATENVYLNGAILGYPREMLDENMEKIIEFSELRDFMDVPIKNFSSGMFARLGFAVATIYTPDILIVDEILSVGDCQVCNRAILLEHGHMIMDEDVEKVCSYFG